MTERIEYFFRLIQKVFLDIAVLLNRPPPPPRINTPKHFYFEITSVFHYSLLLKPKSITFREDGKTNSVFAYVRLRRRRLGKTILLLDTQLRANWSIVRASERALSTEQNIHFRETSQFSARVGPISSNCRRRSQRAADKLRTDDYCRSQIRTKIRVVDLFHTKKINNNNNAEFTVRKNRM